MVAKINNVDTSDFVLKTKYIADKSNLAKKAKLTELENKILSVSNLVKKIDCDTKNYWNWKETYWS